MSLKILINFSDLNQVFDHESSQHDKKYFSNKFCVRNTLSHNFHQKTGQFLHFLKNVLVDDDPNKTV